MRSRALLLLIAGCAVTYAQVRDTAPQLNNPVIQYETAPLDNPVTTLNFRLAEGSIRLKFDSTFGYLPALAQALRVPVESQLMVFSKTSLQSILISPSNPRAILFNDNVAIAFVRGSPTLEIAAQDARQGTVFYTMDQSQQTRPVLVREKVCLGCHITDSSEGVPGMTIRTVLPSETGALVTGLIGDEADHRTPFEMRWGGWYATGRSAPKVHRANAVIANVRDAAGARAAGAPKPEPLKEKFATTGYLTPYSDIVALTVFEHQVHAMNLITRLGWEARVARAKDPPAKTYESAAMKLVDYLLFIDEAPMSEPMEGSSGFAERFAARGPFDSKGRSLRQLDLKTRLLKYPCSYVIYSEAFRSLPREARTMVYERLWAVLSGRNNDRRYDKLTANDRKAIIEILYDTLKDLPEDFKPSPA